MSSIQEIKRRISAVTNTSQITKAMEMVSATKMRRSQEIALLSRPYSVEILRILGELTHRSAYTPKIMEAREVKKTAMVLVAGDRGLAGSFNANIIRTFEKWMIDQHITNETADAYAFISVGKKAEDFLKRKKLSVYKSFKGFGDYVSAKEVKPLTETMIQGFLDMSWDKVMMISTHFRSTLRQEVMSRELLPVNAEAIKEVVKEIIPEHGRYSGVGEDTTDDIIKKEDSFEYLIEPSSESVLDELAPQLVEIILYDFILEANASEHSARMVAMKHASENAEELKDALTLAYNKSRQASVTKEISEIVSGVEALSS